MRTDVNKLCFGIKKKEHSLFSQRSRSYTQCPQGSSHLCVTPETIIPVPEDLVPFPVLWGYQECTQYLNILEVEHPQRCILKWQYQLRPQLLFSFVPITSVLPVNGRDAKADTCLYACSYLKHTIALMTPFRPHEVTLLYHLIENIKWGVW